MPGIYITPVELPFVNFSHDGRWALGVVANGTQRELTLYLAAAASLRAGGRAALAQAVRRRGPGDRPGLPRQCAVPAVAPGVYGEDWYRAGWQASKPNTWQGTHGVNDPRVVVWMSTKTGARLQAASSRGKPVRLRLDWDAGHGVGNANRQRLEERADIYAFLLWQMGVSGLRGEAALCGHADESLRGRARLFGGVPRASPECERIEVPELVQAAGSAARRWRAC